MKIEHSGWSEERGFFSYLIDVDEKKEDYEIHWKDGRIIRQTSPFQEATYDWNNDGDVYTQFGAWFDWDGTGEFLTPVDLVRFVIDGDAEIPGIQHPFRHPSLDEQIHKADAHTPSAAKDRDPHTPER